MFDWHELRYFHVIPLTSLADSFCNSRPPPEHTLISQDYDMIELNFRSNHERDDRGFTGLFINRGRNHINSSYKQYFCDC